MAHNPVKVMLITANVGSIFEDAEQMVSAWLKEFMATVDSLKPGFLAIHCQEVGGKNYEQTMQYVNQFIKALLASKEMLSYNRSKIILDEDFTAANKFTALGTLYFVHESVKEVHMWDFTEFKYIPMVGKEVLSGNIENVPTKEKAKFPLTFFPDCKWSRKGFIRTRWKIYDKKFDLINIHLFHDASNIDAMESSPSVYVGLRNRALKYAFERFENDNLEKLPYFLFGDFNFRLDTHSLVRNLTKNLKPMESRSSKNNEITKIEYREPDDGQQLILIVGKKLFDHEKMREIFYDSNGFKTLDKYDKEKNAFLERVFEYEVNFPPSYPFSEDVTDGTSYMKSRCPGWCDRVFVSHSAKNNLIRSLDNDKPVYSIIGQEACMGDHKPVYLYFTLNSETDSNNVQSEKEPCHKALGKVISINGEEIPIEENQLQHLNIHDFAIFEKEQKLHPITRASIKRKGENTDSLVHHSSFSQVAKDVVRAEGVLMKWLRLPATHSRHHSSSSEDDYETDQESVDEPYLGIQQVDLDDLKVNGGHNNNGNKIVAPPAPDDIPIIVAENSDSLMTIRNATQKPEQKKVLKLTAPDRNDNVTGSWSANNNEPENLAKTNDQLGQMSQGCLDKKEPMTAGVTCGMSGTNTSGYGTDNSSISEHVIVVNTDDSNVVDLDREVQTQGQYKKRYVGRTLTPISTMTDYDSSPCPCKCCIM